MTARRDYAAEMIARLPQIRAQKCEEYRADLAGKSGRINEAATLATPGPIGTMRSELTMRDKRTPLPARDSSFDYGAYLASREWALLKREVRKRSGGICERCHRGVYEETHHLNYRRLGKERLEDLLGVCRLCHAYLSAYSDFDPASICCTPEEAEAWVIALAEEPPEIREAAERHLREVQNAWLE